MKRLFFLCFCALLAAMPARGEGLALSVLTYNIRYDNPGDGEDRWEKRRDEVARLIRDHDPDVVGLQEALRNQLDDLGKALPAYAEIGVGRDDGKTKGEYAAILYRKERFKVMDSGTFWFSDTPEVAGSKSWGNNCVRICTWARLEECGGGGAFWMYNVHLDHESEESRNRSVELLMRRVDHRSGSDPVVVTGDFNAGERSGCIRELGLDLDGQILHGPMRPGVQDAFRDTFRLWQPTEQNAGTFNNFGHVGGTSEKIDYIFIQRPSATTDAGIDGRAKNGRFPSDHFAVWAKVRLRSAYPTALDRATAPRVQLKLR